MLPASCRVFVATSDGGNGFGDKLTRYYMAAAVAARLSDDALALYEGTWRVPTHHAASAAGEYEVALRDVLGLDAVRSVASVRAELQPREVHAAPYAAARAASAACRGVDGAHPPAAVLLLLEADSCPRWRRRWHRFFVDPPTRWCPLDARVPGLETVAWRLRAAARPRIVHSLAQAGALSHFRADALNVAVHLRNGDICLDCDVTAGGFFRAVLHGLVLPALAGCRVRTVFFAQDAAPWVAGLGDAVVTYRNASVAEVSRHFLGASVLVTSGSSLATAVVALAPPFRPLVLEAMAKEATWGCHGRGCPGLSHVLPEGASVRLDRAGRAAASPAELRALLQLEQPDAWQRACSPLRRVG